MYYCQETLYQLLLYQGVLIDEFSKLRYLQLLREAALTHAQYRVLVTLLSYTDQDGTNAHPGFARLTKECQMSAGTVSKAITYLKKAGWIYETAHAWPNPNGASASVFTVKVPEYMSRTK